VQLPPKTGGFLLNFCSRGSRFTAGFYLILDRLIWFCVLTEVDRVFNPGWGGDFVFRMAPPVTLALARLTPFRGFLLLSDLRSFRHSCVLRCLKVVARSGRTAPRFFFRVGFFCWVFLSRFASLLNLSPARAGSSVSFSSDVVGDRGSPCRRPVSSLAGGRAITFGIVYLNPFTRSARPNCSSLALAPATGPAGLHSPPFLPDTRTFLYSGRCSDFPERFFIAPGGFASGFFQRQRSHYCYIPGRKGCRSSRSPAPPAPFPCQLPTLGVVCALSDLLFWTFLPRRGGTSARLFFFYSRQSTTVELLAP